MSGIGAPSVALRRVIQAFALACLFLAPSAFAQEAKKPDFHLDLDTGGHRATVKDLVFTPDGQSLVSASDDKTIRVWDWQSGVTLSVIRGYVGNSNDGKVFAVAVSPDGKMIAAGGYFGEGVGANPPYGDVRLFDLSTGRLKAVLPGNELPVYSVAFAPDGNRLAAAGQDGFVYLWRRDEAAETGWTAETRLDADSLQIQRIAFAAAGSRLAAVTSDYGIRLWNLETLDEIALPPEADKLRDIGVTSLAVSPDGQRFATGSVDGDVEIWKAADGAFEAALPKFDFYVGSLTFAGDGGLVVSCGYRCADKNRSSVFRIGDTAPTRVYAGHDGSVYASAASPDGTLVATAGGTAHAIQVWNPATGELVKAMQGAGLPAMAVGISADGGEIAWGNANPCPDRTACPELMGRLEHRLLLPTADRFFQPPEPLPAGAPAYRRAVQAEGPWSLKAVKGGDVDNGVLEISNGASVTQKIVNDETNGYLHAAFTLVEGGLRVITGGNDGTLIEYFSGTGRQAGEFYNGHTGEIHAMAAAEAANLLVTGSSDQTIRLWNLKTRELIVSLFFAGGEWVVWMPQGYYYSSDEGDKLIGWQVNQGRGKEGRFVRAGQLKKYLWSPEMVRRAIVLRSAEKAVAEMRPGVDGELNRLIERKPPEFAVKVAEDQSTVREGFVAVEISGAKQAGAEVGDFTILSNSRNVGDFTARSIGGGDSTIVEIPVEDGENTIRITGYNEFGYLTERSVVALAKKIRKVEKKGKLYVVVIGVEKYPFLPDACGGHACDLRFPVDDAAEFLRVLASKTAPLFNEMETLVLLNRESLDEMPESAAAVTAMVGGDNVLEPDADTIGDQLKDFLDRPGPDDTTIVFVAGHGINIDEDYYFIPTDGRKRDAEKWKLSSLVDWGDIQKSVERAEGVRFMLLDTCHAANAFNPRLEKDAADARIIVFSATAANNTALELADLGHGVFTYSVLAGLGGAAKTSEDGVTLFGLADYVSREIVRLTGARQKPYYYISDVDNMLLAQP